MIGIVIRKNYKKNYLVKNISRSEEELSSVPILYSMRSDECVCAVENVSGQQMQLLRWCFNDFINTFNNLLCSLIGTQGIKSSISITTRENFHQLESSLFW